jgi:flagellar biosynthesis/type III secretory pathway M-ring protein FliF/YscJ
MEFFAAQAKQIGRQLRGMSASQLVAVFLMLVVLMGGVWGIVHWGSTPDWMPLLDQSFTAEQIQQVQGELIAAGVNSQVQGDRVLIRGDDGERQRVQAVLAQRGALPRDTSLGYSALIKENSVFIGDRSRVWMEHRGLETELSAVIRRFGGIKDAHVFVEVPQQRGLRGNTSASRASVHVTLQDGQALDKQRINAIASFVVGAVSGLEAKNVKITDGVRSYRPHDGADDVPTEILDLQRAAEEHHAQKIQDQLRYIPGVLVAVHAVLRTADEQIQERKLGQPVVDKEMSKSEEMINQSSSAAPGVRPNQGRGLTESPSGSSNSREESETSLQGDRDVTTTSTVKRAGQVERLMASVSIPRSYLERVLAAVSPQKSDKPEPQPESAIQKLAAVELPKIRELVKPLINATADDQVVINWYFDIPQEEKASAETQPSNLMAAARDFGPQVALGLLALGSLWFVMRIAKKAGVSVAKSPAGGLTPAWAGASRGGGGGMGIDGALPTLGGGPITVGEAEEVDGVMVGHEVDDQVVRTQQIVRQISQMVKEDAASAASILGTWLTEEK